MSRQVIASPEELERFARNLKAFNTQLAESMTRLRGQFDNLGNTWRDQEQQKFAVEFEQATRALQRFMSSAEEQIPLLLRKAQHLREFLDQR